MKYIKPISIAIALLISVGCSEDFLERPPLDRLTDGLYYQTDDQVLMGTAPLYNVVWHRYMDNTFINLGDIRAGNMQTNDRQRYYRFAVPSSAFEVAQAWQSFYNTIGQANMVMYYVQNRASDEVSEEVRQHALAEARFVRGLAYYYLVMTWGPVPIISDNLKQMGDTTIARNTIESVWEFAIRDMRFATQYLPETPIAAGRLTKWAAEGMLAKMFLAFSGYAQNGTRDQALLDSARYYAGDVCHNSGLNLLPNYADLFKTEFDNNEESLFAFQWLAQREPWGVNGTFQAFYAYDPKITGTGDGWGAAHGASINLLKEYEPEDTLRRKATFMVFGDYYPEILSTEGGLCYRYRGIYHPDSCASYEERYQADPSQFNSSQHDSLKYIANIKKYIVGTPDDNDGKGATLTTGVNNYVLRLAEVYLVYAESILGNNASTSDEEALEYLNLVRNRAGVPEKSSFTFWDILHEYRIELAIEGNFWYQLMRLYYYDKQKMFDYVAQQDKGYYEIHVHMVSGSREFTYTVESEFYAVDEQTIYLPIPEDEMARAPNLRKPPVPYDFNDN